MDTPLVIEGHHSQRLAEPLMSDQFYSYFDDDGRLVRELQFRKTIFLGGIHNDLRKEAWPFLFGMYPFQSTKREREILLLEFVIKYHEMKAHWKKCLASLPSTEVSSPVAQVPAPFHEDGKMLADVGLVSPTLAGTPVRCRGVHAAQHGASHSGQVHCEQGLCSETLSDQGQNQSGICCHSENCLKNTKQNISPDGSIAELEVDGYKLHLEDLNGLASVQHGGEAGIDSSKQQTLDLCETSHTETNLEMHYSLMVNQFSKNEKLWEEEENKKVQEDLEKIAASEARRFAPNITQTDLEMCGVHLDWNSGDVQRQIKFIDFQAQVSTKRHEVDPSMLLCDLRILKKDVPRTDRQHELFRDSRSPYLEYLRNILITYVFFNPKIGYAQGMSDIAANFLVSFHCEALAFWCFKCYMDCVKEEYTADGLLNKIDEVWQLLNEVDKELWRHLQENELSQFACCQRWLVVGFKRELDFEESLKCFEILNSHYLEMTAMDAELTRRKDRWKDFDDLGGAFRMVSSVDRPPYSFDVFMTTGLLLEIREDIFTWTCNEDAYLGINSIKINLDEAVEKGEQLFHHYCKKIIDECFVEIHPALSGSFSSQN